MTPIHQLNYQHLLYFWIVAKEGSVTRASERLLLAPSTISTQIRTLEESLQVQLFDRTNRRMTMTEMGERVYEYAEELFTLGQEMLDMVHGHLTDRPLKLTIGIADVIPKLVALKLIEPALNLEHPTQLICREARAEDLLSELAGHRLDVLIQDAPVGSDAPVRAFNHLLGECNVVLFGTQELVERYAEPLPTSLDHAPFLLPTPNTTLRKLIDAWFEHQKIRPHIVAEFEDSALMKTFGQRGAGFFPGPEIIRDEIIDQYDVQPVLVMQDVRERFYAVSLERRLKHPGVQALANTARSKLFG